MRQLALSTLLVALVAGCASGSGAAAPVVVAAGHMLAARSGHSAVLLADGEVLIAGGMRRNRDFHASAELFDARTGRFRATGSMKVARVGPAAVRLADGAVLVAGGWTLDGPTAEAELYDPASGRFQVVAPMHERRARPSATLLADGRVLIAGGVAHEGSGGALRSAEIYEPRTHRFVPTGAMRYARVSHTATSLRDGRVLIAGGRDGGGGALVPVAEVFDPARGTFAAAGALVTPRYKHTAARLPDGRVLIAGGSDTRDWDGQLASTEIFDPATLRFASGAPLAQPRFKLDAEAATLPGGAVVVAGGARTVELYDPARRAFSAVRGGIDGDRHFMSATALGDDAVLLAGGYLDDDRATDQAWLLRGAGR